MGTGLYTGNEQLFIGNPAWVQNGADKSKPRESGLRFRVVSAVDLILLESPGMDLWRE